MAIPISDIVNVRPRLISAGQTGLELNGLFLSDNLSLPVGGVLGFTSAADVALYFGSSSDEHTAAAQYFNGYDNSLKTPARLYFGRWVSDDTGAAPYLRTAPLGLTLDELKAVNGTLVVTFSGVDATITLNFNTVTSFSMAASEMQTDLRAAVSGNQNFTGATVTYDSLLDAFVITAGEKGATKTITYTTGTASALLKLTEATGAVISQGADKESPADVMNHILTITDNFVTFSTIADLTDELNLSFAAWASSKDTRFLYVIHSTEANLLIKGDTNNIGSKVITANYSACCSIYGNFQYAAFIMGITGSIDYTRTNGAITYAFKRSTGLAFNISEAGKAEALREKGFNYYGDYSENNSSFTFLYPGSMYGRYSWIDVYVNAVWLNANLQLSGINLLTVIPRVSYNINGYAIIAAALQEPMNQALSSGACEAGVSFSAVQKQELNREAGFDLASLLTANGFYISIADPGAVARGQRLTPIINLWYTYAGAVQKMTINSTLVA